MIMGNGNIQFTVEGIDISELQKTTKALVIKRQVISTNEAYMTKSVPVVGMRIRKQDHVRLSICNKMPQRERSIPEKPKGCRNARNVAGSGTGTSTSLESLTSLASNSCGEDIKRLASLLLRKQTASRSGLPSTPPEGGSVVAVEERI